MVFIGKDFLFILIGGLVFLVSIFYTLIKIERKLNERMGRKMNKRSRCKCGKAKRTLADICPACMKKWVRPIKKL